MVASIAQKVLGNILGKYIEGLDKDKMNIGIWSGSFKIEDVCLKKDITHTFDLPFNLKFNHIGKINAKVPWKSLSNSPVEIELEDLLVIAEPKSKEDLMQIAVNIFKDRQKMLEIFASTIEEKLKKGTKETEDGYVDKLLTKVIDNVQVSIKNIHVRFECGLTDSMNFNFGITLDSLNIFTTDEQGKRLFLDRSKKENKGKPVNKRLFLNDFSFYWNEKEKDPFVTIRTQKDKYGTVFDIPFQPKEKLDIINKLKATISSGMGANKVKNNKFQYLLNLSIEMKMIQFKKTQEIIDQNIPEIELFLELEKLNCTLSKNQFAQIIGLMDYFSDYLSMAKKEKEKLKYKYLRPLKSIQRSKTDSKERKHELIMDWWKFAIRCTQKQMQEDRGFFTVFRMDKQKQGDYEEKFKHMFSRIDYNAGKEITEFLREDEIEVYTTVCLSCEENTLKKWIEHLLKEKQKAQKKESKKGWFGWGKSDNALSADEEKEINDLIDSVVKEDNTKFIVPEDFKWMKIHFVQKEGSLKLQRTNKQKQMQSVINIIKNFEINMMMRKNGMDIQLFLEDFEITLETEISSGNVATSEIFSPLVETHPENKLLEVLVQTYPVGFVKKIGDKELRLDTKINLNIKSSEIYYNSQMVSCLIDVFDTSAEMEALRQAASEQAEEAAKQSKEKLKDVLSTQKLIIIDVQIAAPLIILPFDQEDFFTSE